MADRRLLLLVIYLDILNFFHTGHLTYTLTFTSRANQYNLHPTIFVFPSSFFLHSMIFHDKNKKNAKDFFIAI